LASLPNADNDIRIRYSIDEYEWKFFKDEVKNGHSVSLDDSKWMTVSIPHDFNGGSDGQNYDVFGGRFDFTGDADKRIMYKGPGWYRVEFYIDEKYKDKRIFIEFEAVSLQSTVWVNGKEAGSHAGGYTAFKLDITDYVKFGKPNLLAVRADNSNNPKIAPWMNNEQLAFPNSFDYAIYGGIYRDVWIEITDPIKIERVFNTPSCGGQAPPSVSIGTVVRNYSKKAKEVVLTTEVFDPNKRKVASMKSTKTIQPGEKLSFNQYASALGDVMFWDVNDPNIYNVVSTITYDGIVADEFNSLFGFRYYTYANKQPFSINGEEMLIRGINRHQDMEGLGYALPNGQHQIDAQLIKDAGFNFVRHAHYPGDPEFIRACDELGLMLWLEIPLTGSTSEDPDFLENCKQQMKEMVEQYYNNPSVIVWGIGNESDRSGAPEAVSNKVFSEIVKTAKEIDSNRPITGCNFMYESNQKLVDVYSPQDWSGWYSGAVSSYYPTDIIGEYGADTHLIYHSDEQFDINKNYNASSKPMFWSQEYGAFVHEYKVSLGESLKENFPGHCVWVAFDFASPRADRVSNPIPFMNQKGIIMHDHKTKKDLYYFYQSMYREVSDFPMVYIVSHTWTDRWTEPAKKDIWLYSNCDSVELFNDYGSISFGMRSKESGPRGDTRFQWNGADVKFNVLYAEGWHDNMIVAKDTIILENLPKVK
jgi:beta-galactosidase